jgi:hypothetical protein
MANKNKLDKTKPDKFNAKVRRSKEDRVRISSEVLRVVAPEGRDMSVLLGAAPLALLGVDFRMGLTQLCFWR